MRVWDELELLKAKLRRPTPGESRGSLLRRKAKLLAMVEEHGDKAYYMRLDKKATFTPSTSDVDRGYTSLIAKLHVINLRLDHQLSDRNERRRLDKKRKRIMRKLAGKDPRHFVGLKSGGVPDELRARHDVKAKTTAILDELESDKS